MDDSAGVFLAYGDASSKGVSDLDDLYKGLSALSNGLTFVDRRADLGSLVGAGELRNFPIHRWYYYKEGFSPRLPTLIATELGTGCSQTVADPFAGVATSALALRSHPCVRRIIGVEYSPFACFAGRTKLAGISLDRDRILDHLSRLSEFQVDDLPEPIVPSLSAFSNSAIFDPVTLRLLLLTRDSLLDDALLSEAERNFFLLGVAAVIEDLSGAMKDGRALRILRGRNRRRQGLKPSSGALDGTDVRTVVMNQWLGMVDDLSDEGPPQVEMFHLQGDARALGRLSDTDGRQLFSAESVGLFLYSPPYLNCIDYSEIYKLELWLLGLVASQQSFRMLREGTLRSHPSIEFPLREFETDRTAYVFEVIDAITNFLTENASRSSLGRVHGHYFADMHEVLLEQFRTLEPAGTIACIVANSTFARRSKIEGQRSELWRMPIPTDVILARIAEAIGFRDIQIWVTRDLRAKNVSGALARESVLVAKKPV